MAEVSESGCQGVKFNNKNYWAAESKGNGFMVLLKQRLGQSQEIHRICDNSNGSEHRKAPENRLEIKRIFRRLSFFIGG